MLLVIDNHDSFTFNVVQLLARFERDMEVVASDAISVDEIVRRRPAGIVVSPGPGRPCDAGVSVRAVQLLHTRIPILGVCLGHQALCEALGARVVHAPRLMHGRTSQIRHDGLGLFVGIQGPFTAARYHSLVVEASSLPSVLVPSAFSEQGELMAVRHVSAPLHGVQFHPESFMTEHGAQMLSNFVALSRRFQQRTDAGPSRG